ncbi:hypothetical protein TRAPUB_14075 [Trametes pubescens]|uniref:Uncharacterized protein n=1 Tax=Trametes pubescens TaxID=154538 RepID=A0A1M2VPB3_TRAPU|nr:hypothetical protein TRAPUB_14075 [Trametes pubescens]
MLDDHPDKPKALGTSDHDTHNVPEYEAYKYYGGLSGFGGRGPKLVYRTSTDKFAAPRGPEAYSRVMRLRHVPNNHKLGQEGLWDRIRSEVVRFLDQRGIWFSSVDLARFAWVETRKLNSGDEGNEHEEEEDPAASEEQPDYDELPHFKKFDKVHTTPATIWIGVMPNTTTAEQAYHSSRDILDLLSQHSITGVEIAYRESEVTFSGGPALFAPPRRYLDPLKDVIDNLSSALSVPIAPLREDTQGTLGFYFKAGNELYGVTTRHVLFKDYEPNIEYNYIAGPKKEVVVMGPSAFTAHIEFLQETIRRHEFTLKYLERSIASLTTKAEDISPDPGAEELKDALAKTQEQLTDTRRKMDVVTAHMTDVKAKWRKVEDRVIGHVVWAPPIVAVPPHQYMQDVCVIKLDQEKFLHFKGNVLNLGPELDPSKFVGMMCNNHYDAPCEFEYPLSGLLELHGVLTEEEMRTSPPAEAIRRVIKRGPSTLTTIGRLSPYTSHVRRYYPTGHLDSVETAIHTDHADSLPFSMRGDSGAAIVDARGRFVALLTGGAGINDITYGTPSCEITYGTPMHWLWPLIQAKFEGASLDFGSDKLNH